jgi:hypothetical protein
LRQLHLTPLKTRKAADSLVSSTIEDARSAAGARHTARATCWRGGATSSTSPAPECRIGPAGYP